MLDLRGLSDAIESLSDAIESLLRLTVDLRGLSDAIEDAIESLSDVIERCYWEDVIEMDSVHFNLPSYIVDRLIIFTAFSKIW